MWGEWAGQAVEDTDWGKGSGVWIQIKTMKGDEIAGGVGKRGTLDASCCCFITLLSFINNLNVFNKNDLL